jgi:hypothetical protein
MTEPNISVLYNACYGGFGISKLALQRYNEKIKEQNPEFTEVEYDFEISRIDPVLVEVFHELGEEFNDKYSKIKIYNIPAKYKNFYYIDEYDGKETVDIRFQSYRNYKIQSIVNDTTIDDSMKVQQIKDVLQEAFTYSE